MNKKLFLALHSWPKNFISSIDLALVTGKTGAALHSFIHRTLKQGVLIHVHRGLFLIPSLFTKRHADLFELSHLIYGPSFVSCQSALSFHGLIPEAVYTVTCVTTKRSVEFSTSLGTFSYKKIPTSNFLLGVTRIEQESGIFFMAAPWRAIADLVYTTKPEWLNVQLMKEDLRIENMPFGSDDKRLLSELSEKYPNARTRHLLKRFSEQQNEFSNYSR